MVSNGLVLKKNKKVIIVYRLLQVMEQTQSIHLVPHEDRPNIASDPPRSAEEIDRFGNDHVP